MKARAEHLNGATLVYLAKAMEEYTFRCPFCWETITMMVDLSVPEQDYIEDCEVCCNPLQIHCASDGEQVIQFEVAGSA